MQKRELLIVGRKGDVLLGACRACGAQFRSGAPNDAEGELKVMFDRHKCVPMDSSQNALRVVREATEGK
jgi:hypothetical protein